jgi:hypothetical protein
MYSIYQKKLRLSTNYSLIRTLFKIFKDNDVNYSLEDFKHDGSFYAVWNKIFDDTCKYHDDFGNKPQQAVIDLHNFQKMTNLVPPLPPQEYYNDMLLVLPYKVAQVFCLRAGQEVRLLCMFILTITTTNTVFVFFSCTR